MIIDEAKNSNEFTLNEISILAIKAKNDRSVIITLWEKVEKFVRKFCLKYIDFNTGTSRYDIDDLMQESYLQFEKTIKCYNPDKDMQFLSFLVYFLRHACRIVSGIHTKKRDAIYYSYSIEINLSNNEETTIEDIIADDNSDEPYEKVEDEMAVAFLLEQVDKIDNSLHHYCFIEHAYKNKTFDIIASTLQTTSQNVQRHTEDAAAILRRNPLIKAAYPEYYQRPMINFYTKKGLQSFKTTLSSSVEDTVIRQEFINMIYGKLDKGSYESEKSIGN